MLNVISGKDGAIFSVNATLTGVAVYLDNFAIMDLAEGEPLRRQRFLAAIQSGRSGLLFSVSNVVDLTGPQGASLDAVRSFLDEIGPHWFPVELDPAIVIERERKGAVPPMNCLSERFLRDYFADRLRTYSGKVIDLSPNFFRLGHMLDWIENQRESIRNGMAELDAALIKKIEGYRALSENDAGWLDQSFPAVHFNPRMPATFAYINLVRTLIVEAARGRKLKKGDGLDFCHAVVACGCASAAMLDKHWKRRVETFPTPNQIAPVYCGPNLDALVSDLHACTVQNPAIPAARAGRRSEHEQRFRENRYEPPR